MSQTEALITENKSVYINSEFYFSTNYFLITNNINNKETQLKEKYTEENVQLDKYVCVQNIEER